MRARSLRTDRLPDSTYVELVRSLFATLAPTTIMGILFIVVASMALARRPDEALAAIGVIGGAASLVRVAILLGCERRAGDPALDITAAARAERLFACAYLAFAILLGAFAARALHIADVGTQMVVAALVVGYAAGVAAGTSLRPWISIPAVLLSVLPTAAAAMLVGDVSHAVLALVLVALLAGGIGSMLARYRSETEKIAMRRTLGSLARTDHLTGLANRLALAEAFAQEAARRATAATAVHCLDLDRFKPVNDSLGHPVGDLLLRQVGDRLRSLCRDTDVVARLGGDEFVLLQTGIRHPEEADLMGRRIVRALTEPYSVDGHVISIGVSSGYALTDAGQDLHQLLGRADQALYGVKRRGGGGAARSDGADTPLAATA